MRQPSVVPHQIHEAFGERSLALRFLLFRLFLCD